MPALAVTTSAIATHCGSDSPWPSTRQPADAVTLADRAARRIALNTVSGTTTMEVRPATARPAATLEVGNTDEWFMAIAAGRAVGISTTATPGNHTHPSPAFRPLVDAPPVPVVLAWREGPGHPAVPDLLALTREVPASWACRSASNGRCGRWRDHRQVIDGILHRVRTGVQWRDLLERFGPWRTAYERHRL